MSQESIRAAIFNVLDSISDIGKVHEYERHSTDWSGFLELFRVTIDDVDQVRGWMIGYRGISESKAQTFIPGKSGNERTHRFMILGVMSIDDSKESEKTFAKLAEKVCDTLDEASSLHVVGGFPNAQPTTLGFDPSPFAGVLVHAAAIVIDVVEII